MYIYIYQYIYIYKHITNIHVNISIYKYINISSYQYINISIHQHVHISIYQYILTYTPIYRHIGTSIYRYTDMSTNPPESMDVRFKLSRARPSGSTGPFPLVCLKPLKSSKRCQGPRSAACGPAGTAALPKMVYLGIPLGTLSRTPAELFLTTVV